MRTVACLALLLAGAGCTEPFRFVTESRLRIDGPITAEIVPNSNARPVVAMTVEGGACPGPRVAVVDVDGLILNTDLTGPYSSGDNPVDLFRDKLNAAAADPSVAAVVLRINSPGGSVTATDVMWRELRRFREETHRPVVACLMDLGCGGAYYLATACDQIVAHPTTVTGGVGVLLNLYNLRDAMGAFSITDQSVKAGANIDLGTSVRPLKDKEKALLQEIADEFYERFRTTVRQCRPQTSKAPKTAFDGRVFTATRALEYGLIDRVGYLHDAVAAARELSGQPAAGVAVLHRCNDVARTPYATTPNVPIHGNLLPVSLPGLERSKLPTFLYLWQPEPTFLRLSGK